MNWLLVSYVCVFLFALITGVAILWVIWPMLKKYLRGE